ncbi:MAG: hypothetical protein AMS15_00120 [Planctomycetes bacterium DG_23]|nr:MAG: hypothetical protein AMS15_00120 [Planctomycetes bacterium DG_23]
MVNYDFCLPWNWEHDADFIILVDIACRAQGLSLLQVTPDNLVDILQSLQNNQLNFRSFFDRASDADARFIPIVQWAAEHGVYCINPRERASRTWNKATMHLVFAQAGLETPYTVILPSYEEQPMVAPMDIGPLGEGFIIKPAHGGGGEGVVMKATSWSQVLVARQEYPADRYLLQACMVPAELGSRVAWFRLIYCAGQLYPCWWDTSTHIYTPVTLREESNYHLTALREITASIAGLCGLDLFSTEVALTLDGLFVVVDYVNDQIDLRLQSKAFDGVPDEIVRDITERLVSLAAAHCLSQPKGKDTFL